jgi:hypothetical protein
MQHALLSRRQVRAQPPSSRGWHALAELTSAHGHHRQLITAGADTLVKIFDANNFNAEPRNIEHHEDAINALDINAKVGRQPAGEGGSARR